LAETLPGVLFRSHALARSVSALRGPRRSFDGLRPRQTGTLGSDIEGKSGQVFSSVFAHGGFIFLLGAMKIEDFSILGFEDQIH
jgi:hypothetical protein